MEIHFETHFLNSIFFLKFISYIPFHVHFSNSYINFISKIHFSNSFHNIISFLIFIFTNHLSIHFPIPIDFLIQFQIHTSMSCLRFISQICLHFSNSFSVFKFIFEIHLSNIYSSNSSLNVIYQFPFSIVFPRS